MTSEAKILANQRNGRLARGPVTARGRMVSSQNARKHGLRAATDAVLRDAGFAYEERKQKWVRELNPRTDREEFLAHQQVLTSLMVERIHTAHIEQVTSEIEGVDDRQAVNVHQLGRRLYFNRAGTAALFGCSSYLQKNKVQTSFNGMAVDADDPAMLVAALENSGQGCEWLLGQWRALGERLDGQNFWQSIDRYRAVRLLGAMPTDAGFDRVICEIYVASHGIEPPRKKRPDEDPCQDRAANRPFADLKSDFPKEELTHFVEAMKLRWPDMVSTNDRDGCREILVNLVEENIQRLTALLEVHEEFTEQDAQRTVTRLGFDRSRDVELMRRWELRYRGALDRSIKTFDKVHEKDQAEKEDDRVRRTEQRSPIPPYGSERRRGGGEAGRNMAPDATGERTVNDDTQWARVIDTADVLACGGYLPERCLDGLTNDGEPAAGEGEVAGDQPLDALVPATCEDGLVGSTQPEGHLVGDDFFKESVGPLEDDAMATGQPTVVEANAWRPSVDVGAGSGDPRPAFDGSRIDSGLDNNVTNEPSFSEKEAGLQLHGEIGVTADFETVSALDKLENEPTCEGAATAVGVADSDEASMGGPSPMEHHVRAPAAAISRRQKEKSKRQQHLERKTLARREVQRKLRAHLEAGGTLAEASKLIKDLGEATRQEILAVTARGP